MLESDAKRVLFLTLGLNLTGQSIHIANLAKGLAARGWVSRIGAGDLAPEAPLGEAFFESRGVGTVSLPFFGWNPSWRYVRQQRRALSDLRVAVEDFDPAIIHVHSATLAPLALAARRNGHRARGVVTTFNNERISKGKRLVGRASRIVTRRPFGDRVVAISGEMEERIVRDLRVHRALVRRIDYAVDDEFFRPPTPSERNAAREGFGLGAAECAVACVARLEPRKNQEALVRALPLLSQEGPVRLLLAGPAIGDYRELLKQVASELGVDERVTYLDFVEPRRVYWAADVHVLPSREEGFGLSAVEAMLCGVPTVRSKTAGAEDQIEHGHTGFLVDPDYPEAIAAAVRAVYQDQHVALAGRLHALSRFTIGRMAEQVEGIYREALVAAGSRGRH